MFFEEDYHACGWVTLLFVWVSLWQCVFGWQQLHGRLEVLGCFHGLGVRAWSRQKQHAPIDATQKLGRPKPFKSMNCLSDTSTSAVFGCIHDVHRSTTHANQSSTQTPNFAQNTMHAIIVYCGRRSGIRPNQRWLCRDRAFHDVCVCARLCLAGSFGRDALHSDQPPICKLLFQAMCAPDSRH